MLKGALRYTPRRLHRYPLPCLTIRAGAGRDIPIAYLFTRFQQLPPVAVNQVADRRSERPRGESRCIIISQLVTVRVKIQVFPTMSRSCFIYSKRLGGNAFPNPPKIRCARSFSAAAPPLRPQN